MTRSRLVRLALASALLIGSLGLAAPTAAVVAVYDPSAALIVQEVPSGDLTTNKNGICTSGATHVIKNAQGTFNPTNYANLAAACGMQVIWAFPDTVNYATGRVYTSRVAKWVNKVKNLPNTWGYLSVKEPSWNRISAGEIRALYRAYRKTDPAHKVMALFGDVPHFGTTRNPYTRGMANVVMVDWYPIETTNGSNSRYLTGASNWFPKVRRLVARVSPGTPVYLMVQTHKYLRPATHKKQRPTQTQLWREVREGFGYLHASGIAFHVWRNANYTRDQVRDPQMVSWMADLFAAVKAGTFQ
jgi:hypothetical protein